MDTEYLLMLLEAAVEEYNAGGSPDGLSGKVTDLIAEAREPAAADEAARTEAAFTPSPTTPEGDVMTLTIDPTDLLPGDVVIRVEDHDEAGCHCDVLLTVERRVPIPPHQYHNLDGPAECDRCQLLRDNQHWMAIP